MTIADHTPLTEASSRNFTIQVPATRILSHAGRQKHR
jgi:hypothetical protein